MIPERLLATASELASTADYVTGARRPPPLSADDAVDIVGGLHAQMDEATAARAEHAAARGMPLACGPGCTGCCEELVMVFIPEALAVGRWLTRAENAAARQAFLDAYPAWRRRVGDAADRLSDAFVAGDEAPLLALHMEQWRRRILCAFNAGGLCTIYPVRPLLCRNAHAVGSAAHCYGDDPSGEPVVRLRARSVDAFVENARACVRGAHHALGGPRLRPRALCELVHALLAAAPPAP